MNLMKIEILDRAREDLIEDFHFYERQEPGLSSYFLTNLYADIESLRIYGGPTWIRERLRTGEAD